MKSGKSGKSGKSHSTSDSQQMFADEKRQQEIIAEAQESIKGNTFLMNRALDRGEVDEAFTWASKLIEPLFTSELTPRNYYTLYHLVSSSLLELCIVISDKTRISDEAICQQYEMVQYHRHALQRLYLMIVIGPELPKRTTIKIVDIMDDLTDMLRQAQDPIRGLFLRHFLLSVFKQNLPDDNSRSLERTLGFLLNNFSQMNRLWVRIAGIMAQDNRKSERAELSVLIGMNIQRISSLHGLSVDNYSQMVLPFIAKHVELCEDEMAQEFILQSIVHAFPEEYHMATIDILFGMFGRVEQGVKILTIVNQLLERLVNYVGTSVDQAQGHQIFVTVAKNIEELFSSEGHLALTDKFETLEKLVKFALKINPEDVKNVRNLMKFTDFHIDLAIGDDPLNDATASQKLRSLIECPIDVFTSGESLYPLEFLPVLIQRLMPEDRKSIAQSVCQLYVNSSAPITSLEQLRFVLSVTSPLIRDGAVKSCFFAMFHLIDGGDVSTTMGLLQELANAMETTTEEASSATILPIGMIAIRLMSQTEDDDLLRKLTQFVAIYGKKAVGTNVKGAIMMFTEAAKMLDTLERGEESSELAEMAVTLWDELEDAQLKFRMYNYIMQFVLSSRYVDLSVNAKLGNFASTITDTSKAVIALTNCAALFWRADGRIQEDNKVNACLSKATRVAVGDSSQAGVLACLYQVLSATSWAFDKGVELDQRWVRALINLISDKHEEIKAKGGSLDSVVTPQLKAFYVNTARYIQEHNWVKADEEEDEEDAVE